MVEAAPIPGLDSAIDSQAGKSSPPSVTKFVHVHSPAKDTPIKRTVNSFVKSPKGSEAVLKTLQYTIRLLIHLKRGQHPFLKRLFFLVSSLSALRRLISLTNLILQLQHLPRRLNPFHTLSKEGHLPGRPNSPIRERAIDQFTDFSRTSLDFVAVVFDNLYLFSRLGIIPNKTRDTKREKRWDQISDFATLLNVVIGLSQVVRKRSKVWDESRERRVKVRKFERELEELEFWEDDDKRLPSTEVDGNSQVERENRLRGLVKVERNRLRKLRQEVDKLRWERLKLIAEGIFSAYDAFDLQLAKDATKSFSGATSSFIEAGQAWSDYLKA